jgi:hypothetical protein
MKNVLKSIGGGCAVLALLVSIGCSPELKALAMNQLVGFATAITSAASTSLIQSLFTTTAQ